MCFFWDVTLHNLRTYQHQEMAQSTLLQIVWRGNYISMMSLYLMTNATLIAWVYTLGLSHTGVFVSETECLTASCYLTASGQWHSSDWPEGLPNTCVPLGLHYIIGKGIKVQQVLVHQHRWDIWMSITVCWVASTRCSVMNHSLLSVINRCDDEWRINHAWSHIARNLSGLHSTGILWVKTPYIGLGLILCPSQVELSYSRLRSIWLIPLLPILSP